MMLKSMKVRDFMTVKLITFNPTTDIYDAINKLLEYRISGAPVVNEHGTLVGVFSESDCLRSILNSSYYEEQGGDVLVGNYMAKTVDTISPDMGLVEAAEYFIKNNRRRLPVVEDEILVGQVSRRDILFAVKDFSKK